MNPGFLNVSHLGNQILQQESIVGLFRSMPKSLFPLNVFSMFNVSMKMKTNGWGIKCITKDINTHTHTH